MNLRAFLQVAAALAAGVAIGAQFPSRGEAPSESNVAAATARASELASAPVVDSAPVRAETAAPEAAASPVAAPVVPPAAASEIPLPVLGGEPMLPRALWPLGRKLDTVDKVLENDWFNPERRALDGDSRRELQQILRDTTGALSQIEMEYQVTRGEHVRASLKKGNYEKRLEGDAGILQGRPLNAEEEVSDVGSTRYGDCYVRIHWGDNPDIDRKRIELLDFKTKAVEQIKAFVQQKGK